MLNTSPIGQLLDDYDQAKKFRAIGTPTGNDSSVPDPVPVVVARRAPAPISAPVSNDAPASMAPVRQAAPIGNPKLEADKAELERLQKTGSGVDQFAHQSGGVGHKIASVLARIGDVAGSALFPTITRMIPGTTLHHNMLEENQAARVGNDLETEKEQAAVKNLENPPDKSATEGKTVDTGDGVYQWNPETSKYDIKVGPSKTSNKPLADPKSGYAQAIADAIQNGRDPNTDPHVAAWKSAIDNIAKQEKPDTPEQQFIDEFQKKNPNGTIADAVKAYASATQKPERININTQNARSDKSFQYNSGRLDKLSEPITTLVQRMGRLKDTLAQGSPQADALVAPELLTVMAGGQGSGLRMNEAEIARIVGGRSQWESLKASMNKWKLDPSQANSITPDQRRQIHALVDEVNKKLIAKQKVIDDANDEMLNSDDPKEHRRIIADTRKKLTAVDEGTTGTSKFTDNGVTYNIPSNQVDDFKKDHPNAKRLTNGR